MIKSAGSGVLTLVWLLTVPLCSSISICKVGIMIVPVPRVSND